MPAKIKKKKKDKVQPTRHPVSGPNKLVMGDILEVMAKLKDNSFDACITDPPYNISGYDNKKSIGWYKSNPTWKEKKRFNKIEEDWDKFKDRDYMDFTHDWLSEVKRVVKPNGNIMIFGSYHNIFKIGFLMDVLGLRIINSIVWYKRNAFPNITQRMFCESTETILWAANNDQKTAKNWTFNYDVGKEINGGKQLRNMWDIPMTPLREKEHGKHPSQKPIEVVGRLVRCCTNKGDSIIDPFCGSGTVPVVAKGLGRKYLGIDSNEEYVHLAKRRLKDKNISVATLFDL
jgi:site-specific DNA-methyltransferase (adenine-specific)